MCPACLAATVVFVAKAASAGTVTAIAVKKVRALVNPLKDSRSCSEDPPLRDTSRR